MDLAHPALWPVYRSHALGWLVGPSRGQPFVDNVLAEVGARLVQDGIAIDRMTLHLRTLHPQFYGSRMLWAPGMEVAEFFMVNHDMLDDPRFHNSPIKALYNGAEAIRQRLDLPPAPSGDIYGVYGELRDQGFVDYVALPIDGVDRRRHVATFATRRPGGFRTDDLMRINDVMPVLAMAIEIRMNRRIAKNLLNTYVGQRSGERVLAGDIQRGSGTTVSAAIWQCDLRNFTGISERLPRDEVIALLNAFFDAMGAPVEAHGGEILKFIGDAMLAMFPLDSEDACVRALQAAHEAVRAMAALNDRREAAGQERLGFGLALHVGDVEYGNIGTASRLDFTVIGPAVNAAARLEDLTKTLRRKVLLSGPFAMRCGCSPDFLVPLGSFELRGVGAPLEVFGLVNDV